MIRRKLFMLAGVLVLTAMPLMANVCIEVYQDTPECTEGCITAAQMAALINITLQEASDCLEALAFNGRVDHCTPSGGGTGYCR